ncbi:PTS transporter subunit EIIC [Escherichia coli]
MTARGDVHVRLFPILMFGLPGAALAMYFAAPKERRPMVGGMLLSVAVTALPDRCDWGELEFLFMFLAPLLYLLHALLTGSQPVCGNTAGYPCSLLFLCGGYRLRVDV